MVRRQFSSGEIVLGAIIQGAIFLGGNCLDTRFLNAGANYNFYIAMKSQELLMLSFFKVKIGCLQNLNDAIIREWLLKNVLTLVLGKHFRDIVLY